MAHLETILLVEDEEVVRAAVARLLRDRGYTVLDAAGGNQALEALGPALGRIDLLISDLAMPHMDGVDLARRLREKAPSLAVLFMSGGSPNLGPDLETGSVSFLDKPFSVEQLSRKVRQTLDQRPHPDGASSVTAASRI